MTLPTRQQIIGLYNEVDKKYTDCNLKTTELLDSELIWVCAVIRLNKVIEMYLICMKIQCTSFSGGCLISFLLLHHLKSKGQAQRTIQQRHVAFKTAVRKKLSTLC